MNLQGFPTISAINSNNTIVASTTDSQHSDIYTRGSWKCGFSASDYKFLAKSVFRRFSVD